MITQNATCVSNGHVNNQASSMRRTISHIAQLAALQGKLLRADLLLGASRLKIAALLASLSLASLIAAVPVALVSFAFWLRDSQGLPMVASLAVAAGVGLMIGLLAAAAAWRLGKNSFATVDRSYQEFLENISILAPKGDSSEEEFEDRTCTGVS